MGSGVACKEGIGSLPVKRKPDDEVQFVSSKPVKKCRGSRDSPAEANHVVNNAADMSRAAVLTLGNAHPGITPGSVGPSLPTSQPQLEPSTFNRGVSLPSMENYVFPPPDDGITSRTSRSSPMLSPKQLPQGVPSSQPDSQVTAGAQPTPFKINDPKPPVWFDTPTWPAPSVPLQQMPMGLHMAPSQPMMPPSVQQLGPEPSAALQDEKQQRNTSDKSADPVHCFEPVTQPRKEMSIEHTQNEHQYPPQRNPEPAQTTQPSGIQKAWQPTQPAPQTPPGPVPRTQPPAQQQQASNSIGYAMTTVQPLPAKPPCFACEQMRQQALRNKTNGFQIVGNASHVHHGWHGPDIAHLTHPTHMQPAPFPTPGFGVSPDVAQGHLHRPPHLYHGQVPMGYGMAHVSTQAPYSSPVQRAFPVADMSASESVQGLDSHKFNHNPQLNVSLGPKTVSQTERARHVQGQSSPPRPQATPPKSTTATSPTPPAAPKSRPPTPSPPEKHSPNLIVDIAETCEAMFPWDEVAERHNVPRQKVVDTFAAIIQLPLIRCTTDKKRHGRLATNRLKDFTRGKNAMGISSNASAATPSAPAKSDSNGTQDNAPVLPSVVDLANSMAPVGFPSTLTKKYPGTW